MANDRQEPQSLEAEISVLGAMILDRDAIPKVLEILDESSFYLDSHRRIYKAIVSLYDKNVAVDLVTLAEKLQKSKELNKVGGREYLASLLDKVASSANVVHYAEIVRDRATLRKMISAATNIIEAGYDISADADNTLDKAEQLIFSIKETRVKAGFVPIRAILKHSFDVIDQLYEKKMQVTGVPSGFTELDKMTAGFQPSEFIIVAGRPSMGKTSFCLNIAVHVAVKHEVPVGIFSLETSKEMLVQRMLCSEARVSFSKVRTGYIKEEDYGTLARAAGILSEAPIYIDDTPAIPILELRAKARRLKSKENLGLLIVDYLQLMTGPKSENRQQEISAISRALKGLARELSIPLIAVSQLSRAVEVRGRGKPRLSDLRESGAIEQDADVVIFIYRPEEYDKTGKEDVAEIDIAKQRNGPTGSRPLAFLKEYTRFENLAAVESEFIEEEPVE